MSTECHGGCLKSVKRPLKDALRMFKAFSKDVSTVFLGCFNPLSPGVLDPGNYPGEGPQDPQLYFAFHAPRNNVEPHI